MCSTFFSSRAINSKFCPLKILPHAKTFLRTPTATSNSVWYTFDEAWFTNENPIIESNKAAHRILITYSEWRGRSLREATYITIDWLTIIIVTKTFYSVSKKHVTGALVSICQMRMVCLIGSRNCIGVVILFFIITVPACRKYCIVLHCICICIVLYIDIYLVTQLLPM